MTFLTVIELVLEQCCLSQRLHFQKEPFPKLRLFPQRPYHELGTSPFIRLFISSFHELFANDMGVRKVGPTLDTRAVDIAWNNGFRLPQFMFESLYCQVVLCYICQLSGFDPKSQGFGLKSPGSGFNVDISR